MFGFATESVVSFVNDAKGRGSGASKLSLFSITGKWDGYLALSANGHATTREISILATFDKLEDNAITSVELTCCGL